MANVAIWTGAVVAVHAFAALGVVLARLGGTLVCVGLAVIPHIPRDALADILGDVIDTGSTVHAGTGRTLREVDLAIIPQVPSAALAHVEMRIERCPDVTVGADKYVGAGLRACSRVCAWR